MWSLIELLGKMGCPVYQFLFVKKFPNSLLGKIPAVVISKSFNMIGVSKFIVSSRVALSQKKCFDVGFNEMFKCP